VTSETLTDVKETAPAERLLLMPLIGTGRVVDVLAAAWYNTVVVVVEEMPVAVETLVILAVLASRRL